MDLGESILAVFVALGLDVFAQGLAESDRDLFRRARAGHFLLEASAVDNGACGILRGVLLIADPVSTHESKIRHSPALIPMHSSWNCC